MPNEDQKEPSQPDVDRRTFLRGAAGAAAAAATVSQQAKADVITSLLPRTIIGANERIRTGHIGLGGMGKNNLRIALLRKDIEPIHMCDLWTEHAEQGADITENRHNRPTITTRFEEVIENKDVDAVVVATPDHWHAVPTLMACDAGKAVYCEKPMTTTIPEGRAIVDAVKRNDTVFQMGTMQRSGEHFQEAVELIRSGHIGQVAKVETWANDQKKITEYTEHQDEDPPEGLDWDRYVGWTTKVPYNRARWLNSFRWFLDYSGGKITDWGTHLVDIVVWGMGQDKPVRRVNGSGGKFVLQDVTTTPDTLDVVWEFDDYHLSFASRLWNPMPLGRGIQYGIMFHGTLGTLHVDRRGYRVYPFKHNGGCEALVKEKQSEMALNTRHWENFAHCIRTGETPICDVDTGYNSTKICQIGTAAMVAGARLDWDDKSERFTGPDAAAATRANEFAHREYQNGWSLEAPYYRA